MNIMPGSKTVTSHKRELSNNNNKSDNKKKTNNNSKPNNNNNLNKNTPTIKMKSDLVQHFLEMLMTIKIYHWRTYSYAEHKATDELFDKLNENIDKFVEIMLGKVDGPRLEMKNKNIPLKDPKTKLELKKIVSGYKNLLAKKMDLYINVVRDTDLLNIRDEILGHLNQFIYLLTLN